MASKSLGTLTLDLLVQTGGFESGMERAERVANQRTRNIEKQAVERAKAIENAFGNMARSLAAPLAGAFSLNAVSSFTSALLQAQQNTDKLRNSLTYATGSAESASREIGYLRDVTRSLGLDFNSASAAYAKFAAATKGSGITAEQTKSIFEGVAAAAAKIGLSADETQGALLALSQMASKGVVNAEELRGQLGERLPGALKIAAQAMGMTQAEFSKLLESGKLLASDFLPKFGQALKNEFAGSVNSLTQEINRLNSSWDTWKQNFSNADGGSFRWLTNGINESAAAMRNLGKEAGIAHKLLVAIGGFNAGAIGAGRFDTAKLQEQAFQTLAEIKQQRQQLEEQKEKYGSLPPITERRFASLKAEEQTVRDRINALAVQRGKDTGMQLPDLAGEFLAQKQKADERLKAYLDDTANAPKALKIAAEVEKENKAFQAAVVGLSETDERYISTLRAHHARLAEIRKRGDETSDGERLVDTLRKRLHSVEHLTELEKLQAELSAGHYKNATEGEKRVAAGIAEQIDARKKLATELDGELDRVKQMNAEYDKQASRLNTLIGSTSSGQNMQKMQDEAIAESALRAGKIDTATYDQIIEKLHEVKDEGKDVFKELQDAIEGWGRASTEAMVEFAFTGKASVSDMVTSIAKDLARMAIQQNVTKPLFNWISTAASAMFAANANGGVYDSPGLSAYSGQIVSTPTVFPFAKGIGLMGEAGPEAILPLSRGADGKLGVRAGGSTTGDVNISITINESGEKSSGNGGDGRAAWGQFAGRVKTLVLEELQNQKRPGGLLHG